MLNVLFICKGSERVGLGHVMRCRTVAAAMKTQAHIQVILVGSRRIGQSVLESHVPYTVASADADCMDFVRAFEPDVAVFDLLEFDRACFDAIDEKCMTVSISPIFDRLTRVDMIFSRAAFPEPPCADDGYLPVVKMGYEYVTIGEHCQKVAHDVYEKHLAMNPLSVAVSMGGADAPNRTLRILEAIKAIPEQLLIWVLLGEEYAHSYQQLVDCVWEDRRHEIILARTTDSMWRILHGCSLAILAGGITTYEAAYCGIPSIVTLDEIRIIVLSVASGTLSIS